MTDYISITETNKLIRKVLKESFPGVKFSVRGRSYSMGGSTDIYWTDGPNEMQVKGVVSVFEGSYFDGMIDYKGSRYATLDGQDVSFGPDFIFCNRVNSDDFELRMIKRISAKYANQCDYLRAAPPSKIITDYHKGHLYNISPYAGAELTAGSPWTVQALIRSALTKHTFIPFAQLSPTLARVSFKGDDGYGAGCVGRDGDGKGEGYGGYPQSERVSS